MTTDTTQFKNHDIHAELGDLLTKYHDLVWYARSNPASDVDYWKNVPEAIREGAFKAQMRVEEEYPNEVTRLRGDGSDWEHGFNSGMLAAMNFVLTASRSVLLDDGEETFWYGGIEDAKEEFPMLDT